MSTLDGGVCEGRHEGKIKIIGTQKKKLAVGMAEADIASIYGRDKMITVTPIAGNLLAMNLVRPRKRYSP